MREALLWVHRWLGLTAGIVFGIAAGTGAVLVYQPQLDTLLGGPRWGATEGTQTPAAIETAVRGAQPDARIAAVTWPTEGENAVRVDTEADGKASVLWVDNGSGRLLQPRRQVTILLAIRRLHVNLLMGPIGRQLVLWTTWIALLSLALGAYLWWPGIRRFWSGFRIRLKRGAYILNFDLHQALGIVALPLLLFGSATGVLLSQPGIVDWFSETMHGPEVDYSLADVRSATPPDVEPGTTPGLATLVGWARAVAPDAYLVNLSIPVEPDGAIHAELSGEHEAILRLALDRYSGAVLDSTREERGFRYGRETNEELHVAHIGGPVFRVLYMLACVVGFVMLPTGVIMWWIKRTRKAASAERRAVATVSRTADV